MTTIPLYNMTVNHTTTVYNSGSWIDGTCMHNLQEALAKYLDIPYVILTNSGTSALLAAYWVLRKQYERLYVDPYTFPATYQPARMLGYDVTFVKTVLANGSNFKEEGLATITHLFGQPNHALSQSLPQDFIEDACQSFGAEYRGKKVGTFGKFGCFSFYPTKSLHTCGHGGALVTRDADAYKAAKVFIESGRDNGVMTDFVALNLRMDEIKAEFLLQELQDYDQKMERQREIARQFMELVPGDQPFLREDKADRHVYSVFNMHIEKRDDFRRHMQARGIQTAVYYDASILPEMEREKYTHITDRIVSIPCRANLSKPEIRRIKEALQKWFR